MLLLFAFGTHTNSQPPKAILVDSVRKPTCEVLWSRLDYLAAQATEKSGYGIVAIHQGKNVFENSAYERAIRNNSVFRNFPNGLIRTLWVKSDDDEPNLEFFRSENGTDASYRDIPLDYVVNIRSRTRVVDDSLEILKLDGKLDYVGGDCKSTFSLEVLSKVLSSNPDLRAEIVIFNKTKSGAQRLSSLIRKSALSEYGILNNRLKIIHGGGGQAKEWKTQISAVEIWLLPSKRK